MTYLWDDANLDVAMWLGDTEKGVALGANILAEHARLLIDVPFLLE